MPQSYHEVSPNYFTLDPQSADSKTIAASFKWYSPKFSPKDVPRFYDVSSVTEYPEVFKTVLKVLVTRYREKPENERPTHILGYDARGFLLGAPLAVELGLPFVLLRKAEKSPGVLVKSDPYHKEYAEASADTMAIRLGSIGKGSRVVLVDDLIATGGTAISGFQLCEALGAQVVEFTAMIGIPFLNGVEKIHTYANGHFKSVPVFTLIHDSQVPDDNCGDPKDWPADKPRVLPAESIGK
jgi:adenine phosphoribosyltransferase